MSRSPLLQGATGEREMATRMGQARMIIGASAILGNSLVQLLYGFPRRHDNPSARTLARAFGIRNVVIGAWTLKNRDADLESRRNWYRVNALIDAVDVAAFMLPLLRRQGTTRLSLSAGAVGTAAALAWIDLLDAAAGESAARAVRPSA